MEGSQVNNREVILGVLLEVMEGGEYSHIAIRNALEKYQYLKKQERNFIKRICQGTLERMITIDYIISRFSKVKISKMNPTIRCILRSGVYELKYMDSVPAAATCNEAVKLAQKRGLGNLKGFVNGVLRSIARNLDNIALPGQEDSREFLSVAYSMPQWILKLWEKSYSPEQMKGFLEAFLTEAPTAVHVNTMQATKEALKEELAAEGVKATDIPGISDALWIENYDYLRGIPAFGAGKLYVQDPSSMQAALWADPPMDGYVIDVCAAPGGKSLHAAMLMQGTGLVEARDLTPYKVSLIQENAERCQMGNIRPMAADARLLDRERVGKADVVIADLPCSGLGALGKRPDLKYKMSPNMCQELSLLQREILHTVQQYVKPGGTLIYSTCTINPAENEENVEWFLKLHPHFILERQQQILPGSAAQEGFFLAKLTARRQEAQCPGDLPVVRGQERQCLDELPMPGAKGEADGGNKGKE